MVAVPRSGGGVPSAVLIRWVVVVGGSFGTEETVNNSYRGNNAGAEGDVALEYQTLW